MLALGVRAVMAQTQNEWARPMRALSNPPRWKIEQLLHGLRLFHRAPSPQPHQLFSLDQIGSRSLLTLVNIHVNHC
jgi:hypothetical protein